MVLAALVDRLIAYTRYYISKVVTSSPAVVGAALCSHVHAYMRAICARAREGYEQSLSTTCQTVNS